MTDSEKLKIVEEILYEAILNYDDKPYTSNAVSEIVRQIHAKLGEDSFVNS
jgi:hypothetical protein